MGQNPKVHHRIHNTQPAIGPILSQLNPLYTALANVPKIHFDPILPSMPQSSLSSLFPLAFPTKTLYTFVSSPMHATRPVHLTILDLTCLMIFGDELFIH
jgi:hypothetical protein